MSKKRLIVTSLISIILVGVLMLGSTYSLFTLSEDTTALENNVYQTGNLSISYSLSSITLDNSMPMSEEEADSITPYRITITNSGNVPYSFNLILEDTTAYTVINYKYIMTKVGYLDSKSLEDCNSNIIKEDIILPAGESVNIDVRVWISDEVKNSEIGKSFYAKLKIDGLAVYNNNSDIDNDILSLNYMKTSSVYDFRHSDYIEKIKSVTFVQNKDTTNAIKIWDMSDEEDDENTVLAWVTNNETEGYYDLYIGSNYKIYAKSLDRFFAGLTNVESINFNNLLDTSFTTNMKAVFLSCTNLVTLDVSNFDTSNVTNMTGMFCNCINLATLDVSNFDTSNVTNMTGMFCNCINLATLDVSNFDTSQVTNMAWMFGGGAGTVMQLRELDVSGFDTSNVTNMRTMFQNCKNLTELDVSNFDTSKVTDMSYMFCNCIKLTTLDLSNFNTSKVTNMNSMLGSTISEGNTMNLTYLDVSSFDTSNVEDMYGMFQNLRNLTSLDLSNFDTSKVTNMEKIFKETGSNTTNFTLDISSFTFDNVTSYSEMFVNFKTTNTIYVKSSTEQSWILDKGFANLSTSNVIIKE